jgi:signal transduction histidine kinase
MHQASERSAQVVMTLRSYLKANSDSLKPISLDKSIQTVIQIFNHELKYKIALGYNVPDDLIIMGYESKLFQLWSNLIKNALEAMTEGGELNIEAYRKANCIHVCIENTGPEIPKEIKHHIFDKFFTTKDAQNGTGLGLSIVKKVIEEHSASIKVNSSPARTKFEIIFDANS